MRYILIGILMVLPAISLYGARPFATDDAGTVSAVGYELELGYDFGEDEGILGLSFKHGLTPKMDVGIEFGYTTLSLPKNRFTPAGLCLKYAILPDFFSVSVSNELGASSYDLNAIFTKPLGLIEFDVNLGYSIPGDWSEGTAFYAFALIVGFNKFDIGGEVLGNEDELETWLLGGRYKLLEGFNLDIGIYGNFEGENKVMGTIGLHYEF